MSADHAYLLGVATGALAVMLLFTLDAILHAVRLQRAQHARRQDTP